ADVARLLREAPRERGVLPRMLEARAVEQERARERDRVAAVRRRLDGEAAAALDGLHEPDEPSRVEVGPVHEADDPPVRAEAGGVAREQQVLVEERRRGERLALTADAEEKELYPSSFERDEPCADLRIHGRVRRPARDDDGAADGRGLVFRLERLADAGAEPRPDGEVPDGAPVLLVH